MELLLIPPISVCAAIAWNAWAGRTRKPLSVAESVHEHQRLLRALAAPFSHHRDSSRTR